MKIFDKLDLKRYAPIAVDALYDDVVTKLDNKYGSGSEEGANFDLILNLLHLGFTGKADFAKNEVKAAFNGRVHSPRDVDDALKALSPSSTPFVLWSSRDFIRNFDKHGNLTKSGDENIPTPLRNTGYQLRILDMWLGDHQGEPDARSAELMRLMSAQLQIERQVRESFSMINDRSRAIETLQRNVGVIAELPAESMVIQLERVLRAKNALTGTGAGQTTEMQVDVTWTLGGRGSISISSDRGLLLENEIRSMHSSDVITSLPVKIAQASRAYAPKY